MEDHLISLRREKHILAYLLDPSISKVNGSHEETCGDTEKLFDDEYNG